MKLGTPQDAELEELAFDIAEKWKTLGRRLNIRESLLQEIDHTIAQMPEKGYQMLAHWKRREGTSATYEALHDALVHQLVNRQDIAEKFCSVDR